MDSSPSSQVPVPDWLRARQDFGSKTRQCKMKKSHFLPNEFFDLTALKKKCSGMVEELDSAYSPEPQHGKMKLPFHVSLLHKNNTDAGEIYPYCEPTCAEEGKKQNWLL